MSVALSVVIPARNEAGSIAPTVRGIHDALAGANITHEILVVDDGSTDDTWNVLTTLAQQVATLRSVKNTGEHGFGCAIRYGLERFAGESVCVMMADGSDPPEDLVRFHQLRHAQGVDCVFGSRAMRGAKVVGYPPFKWCMNRAANLFLCVVFGYRYNDTTNPFKLYRRAVIERIAPFSSTGFELEIEIPLKAIISGATYTVAPNGWNGREAGASKMKVLKLVRPYLRVVHDCLALRRASRSRRS